MILASKSETLQRLKACLLKFWMKKNTTVEFIGNKTPTFSFAATVSLVQVQLVANVNQC